MLYRGVAIVYISHRMKEIEEICDRVSVLRDGRNEGVVEMSSTSCCSLTESCLTSVRTSRSAPSSLRMRSASPYIFFQSTIPYRFL